MSYEGKIKWRQNMYEMLDRDYLKTLDELYTLRRECENLAKDIFYGEGLIRIPDFLVQGIWLDNTLGKISEMKKMAIYLRQLKGELEILSEEQHKSMDENHEAEIKKREEKNETNSQA